MAYRINEENILDNDRNTRNDNAITLIRIEDIVNNNYESSASISYSESAIMNRIYSDVISISDMLLGVDLTNRLKCDSILSKFKMSIGSCNVNISN